MRANPGGRIEPQNIVGRDGLIAELWRELERRSVVLSSERRMGKTCVIQKMTAEAPEGTLPVLHDLEAVRSPLEFVEGVFHDVEGYLSGFRRVAVRARNLLAHLSGAEFRGVKIPEIAASHWKDLLEKLIQDLAEHLEGTLVFFWDEFPLMIHNIKEKRGVEEATQLLDLLRSLRQMHPQIRMVFTGSIGLQNVIVGLKQDGYANEPINDMARVSLPPLALPDAEDLSRRLLEGEGLQAGNPHALVRSIARETDCIPYLVHHVVNAMAMDEGEPTPETVERIVLAGLTGVDDAWDMRHYRTRIDRYYSTKEIPYALGILDVLGASNIVLPFKDVFNGLKSQIETEDQERTREVLILLLGDHYVLQEGGGGYRFQFPIVRRWWRLHRGIGS